MFTWDLPQALEVGGRMYKIRTDFRPALDILVAFNDPELPEENKIQVMMEILFVELPPEEYLNEAVERAYWYLDCGKRSDGKAGPRVMDWEQDASMIFSAINKVAGYELRNPQRYTHWWTFAGYFDEIDEGIFSQVLAIRQKRAKGKKLEKWEEEFLHEHRSLVILENKTSEEEQKRIAAEEAAVDALFKGVY